MTELTADLIVDLAAPMELALSPDSRWVAYTLAPLSKREEHRASAIWLAPTDGSREPRQLTSGTAEDKTPQWSPDGQWIAFLSDRATRGTAQLYRIAVDGGEAQPLTKTDHKRGVNSFAWAPDGKSIAFISADEPTQEDEKREKDRDDAQVFGERLRYGRLRRIDVETGEVKTLVSLDRHVAEFAWSPDGQSIAYLLWTGPDLEWASRDPECQRVKVAHGAVQSVGRFKSRASGTTWSPDGETLLFLAPATGRTQGSNAVWAMSASGGEPRRIALGDTSCAGGLRQTVDGARVVVSIGEGLDTHLAWLDAATGGVDTFYSTAKADGAGDLLGWSVTRTVAGDTRMAGVLASGTQPWEVWAGPPSDLCPVTHHQTALADIRFGTQEAFHWTAPDGWAMDGLLIRPPDAPPGPLPLVTLVHGGPYGRYAPGFHLSWGNWAQWLATAGYAILMPNYRGGFGHGERFAASARGGVGEGDFPDVLSAVDAAIERGIADPNRLAIGGWSQGGFMSAWAITQTDRFKTAIIGAGVTDWGMMTMTTDVPDFELELGESAPWDGVGPHRHVALSPISYARRAKTPSLILHGEKDARVPLTQAIGLHRALRDVGCPTELVVYPREPHGIGERAHQLDVLRRVRAWIDRWLKA